MNKADGERFRVYADAEAVAQAVAEYLHMQIEDCIAVSGQCHVVLPGGTTPARCLEILAEKTLPWQNIHWYPGDERCYPVGHAERNDTMIRDRLFSRQQDADKKIIDKNFHPIPAELGPEQGAETYTRLLDATGKMDIVVLGMGEDGHTASLFPGNAAIDDQASAVAVYGAPKPPAERVSVGLNTLKDAGVRIIIATGEGKREVLTKLKQGEVFPVGMVAPDLWFVDLAAV